MGLTILPVVAIVCIACNSKLARGLQPPAAGGATARPPQLAHPPLDLPWLFRMLLWC